MAADEKKVPPEQVVRTIRRQTRHKLCADEKIRIVPDGPRGEVRVVGARLREITCTSRVVL